MSNSKVCVLCKGVEEDKAECNFCEGTGFDIQHTDLPVCPHCGEEYEIEAEEMPDDGSSEEFHCGSCEQPFEVTPSFSISYCTTKK